MSLTIPATADPSAAPIPSGLVAGGRDLHVLDLCVSYERARQRVDAVQALTFYAPSSRITALVGRSGTGKTSVLSCVAATLRPTSGTIWLGGIDVTSLARGPLDHYRRRMVGIVHQNYNLIPSLTALENVVVPMTLLGVPRRAAADRAAGLLDRLGLGSAAGRRPGELSGGQQQRVAVARAIANDPSVVVADEPTAHLDGTSVGDVRDLLREVAAEGRTVILSTHDDRLLSAVDQTIVMGV